MSRWIVRLIANLGLLVAATIMSEAARASVFVLDSSVDNIPKHQELGDDEVIKVPFGEQLSVVVNQDGALKTVRINGQREGKVKDLLNPEPIPAKLWNAIIHMVQTGGADQSASAAGRGFPMMVNDVAVERGVVVCVEDGTSPTIKLAPGSAGNSLRISDSTGAQSARRDLAAGASSVAWPAEVPIRDGDVYRIISEKTPQFEFRLRIVPAGTLANATLVKNLDALDSRGCSRQFNAALKMFAQH
jgi:hypothetical protein